MADLAPAWLALCDNCLGRRLIGAAGTAAQRGAAAEARKGVGAPEVPEARCPVCEGAFADHDKWLAAALQAGHPYEFSTFQVGTQFPTPGEALEKDLARASGGEVGESIRTQANRLLAAAIAQATGAKTVADGRPDLVLHVDTRSWTATAEASSAFVRGRYTKLRRDIPQTHWPCRRCEGRGCWECEDTGVTYAESVEDAVSGPARAAFAAPASSFHGAGREDIDALMLGTGRPFLVELRDPRRRRADLEALEAAINASTSRTGVGVSGLALAAKEEVAAIKEGEYEKEYLAHCVAQVPVARSALDAAASRLAGTTLEQRTPGRVSHRRADLVRRRAVREAAVTAVDQDPGTRFDLRVRAESGTYIKEMVSGDEGRTTPSFSGLLGVPVKVEALDVLAILDGPATAAAPAAPAPPAT